MWKLTIYTAPGNYPPSQRIERIETYRWRWLAVLRSIIIFRRCDEPDWIARWGDIELA